MNENLLNLVRQYGLQEREDAGSTRGPMSAKAAGLFDQIAKAVQRGGAAGEELAAVEKRLAVVERRLLGIVEQHHLWDGS